VLTATNPANGWSQYLKVSRVGSTEYFDEGNRGTPQPAPSRAF
jgi:hypothetical protein